MRKKGKKNGNASIPEKKRNCGNAIIQETKNNGNANVLLNVRTVQKGSSGERCEE